MYPHCCPVKRISARDILALTIKVHPLALSVLKEDKRKFHLLDGILIGAVTIVNFIAYHNAEETQEYRAPQVSVKTFKHALETQNISQLMEKLRVSQLNIPRSNIVAFQACLCLPSKADLFRRFGHQHLQYCLLDFFGGMCWKSEA